MIESDVFHVEHTLLLVDVAMRHIHDCYIARPVKIPELDID